MLDIHNHFVWGLDDGAASAQQSLAMLDIAATDGTTDIVATPHRNARFACPPDVLRERLAGLAAKSGGKIALHCGCEFQFTVDNAGPLLDNPYAYTIAGGPYLLLELPDFHIARHTDSLLRRLTGQNIVPILAHPERNPALLGDLARLEAWVDQGCLVQLTASSITGGFGGPARSAALRLLHRGLAHLVASDAHDPLHRPPVLSTAFQSIRRSIGLETAEILFRDHPRAIVEGRPIAARMSAEPKRHWWHLAWRRH